MQHPWLHERRVIGAEAAHDGSGRRSQAADLGERGVLLAGAGIANLVSFEGVISSAPASVTIWERGPSRCPCSRTASSTLIVTRECSRHSRFTVVFRDTFEEVYG